MTTAYETECQDDDERWAALERFYTREPRALVSANDNSWQDEPLPVWVTVGLATAAVVLAVFIGSALAYGAQFVQSM